MKKIKMIGLDLDGTLLNDKKELTSHTREILTRAIDQGVTVLVATGQPLQRLQELTKSLPKTDPLYGSSRPQNITLNRFN